MHLLTILAVGGLLAADPPKAYWADQPLLAPFNHELPSWVQFSGEYRMRFEGFSNLGFRDENDDHYALNRVRLNLRLKPASWLNFYVQAQDSRVWFTNRVASTPPLQNRADLRLAYVDVGNSEGNNVRVGRQELIFGEERLVGAGNWGNTARSFDAARLNLRHKGYRVSLFASSVVVQKDGWFDHHAQGSNLHGLYASVESWIPKAKVEPFVFWRVAGPIDFKTVGTRLAGAMGTKTDYVVEMALQRGTVEAWAGHWRIERTLSASPKRPRLRLEYNYATGDRDPNDSRRETFDVLYPTPHDKYGLADQVGWRNVQHAGAIVEFKPIPKLTLQAKYHTWWLAQARDGLYNAGGALLVRDPTGRSGTHVGEEVDVQALWPIGKQVNLGGGLGHMFAGEFLKKTTPGAGYTFPYVMLTFGF